MRSPEEELAEIEGAGLLRQLRCIGPVQGTRIELEEFGSCVNFSSNDYLGLANDPRLKTTFQENIGRHGTGSGASRLVCGNLSPHAELEEALANFKRTEASLTFSSGFAVASGILPALCGKDDVIILDKLSHACLIDGAKLSGAALRVFPHNDLGKLESHLQWASSRTGEKGRILVATESIFSMDGDRAPLREIVDLKERYNALLLLDEAHAFGIVGPGGSGLAAEKGVDQRVDLQMGTFSKAAGLSGGYLCGSRALMDLFINKARSFIYSTAPSPALVATIRDSLALLSGKDGDELRERLWSRIVMFDPRAESAIVPMLIGESETALSVSRGLLEKGFLVPAIRFPTVPRGTARLRITLSAAHETDDISALKGVLADIPGIPLSD